MTTSWEDLRGLVYKRWYQFGWRSPKVLFARLHHKYKHAFLRLRMAWQRARHEFCESQYWSLDQTVAHLVVAGVKYQRASQHGHPIEFGSWEAWDAILAKIEAGFQAYIDDSGWFDNPAAEAAYKEGMALFSEWFGGLWD